LLQKAANGFEINSPADSAGITPEKMSRMDPIMALGIIILYRILPLALFFGALIAILQYRKAPSRAKGALLILSLGLCALWIKFLGMELLSREWSAATAPVVELRLPDDYSHAFILLQAIRLPDAPPSGPISVPSRGLAKTTFDSKTFGNPELKFMGSKGQRFYATSRAVDATRGIAWYLLTPEGRSPPGHHLDSAAIERAFREDLELSELLKTETPEESSR
jgi:hypothetical protein